MLPIQTNETPLTTFEDGVLHPECSSLAHPMNLYDISSFNSPNGEEYTIARPKSGTGSWFVFDPDTGAWEDNATFDAVGYIVVPVQSTYGATNQAVPTTPSASPTVNPGTSPMKTVVEEIRMVSSVDPFTAALDRLGIAP